MSHLDQVSLLPGKISLWPVANAQVEHLNETLENDYLHIKCWGEELALRTVCLPDELPKHYTFLPRCVTCIFNDKSSHQNQGPMLGFVILQSFFSNSMLQRQAKKVKGKEYMDKLHQVTPNIFQGEQVPLLKNAQTSEAQDITWSSVRKESTGQGTGTIIHWEEFIHDQEKWSMGDGAPNSLEHHPMKGSSLVIPT